MLRPLTLTLAIAALTLSCGSRPPRPPGAPEGSKDVRMGATKDDQSQCEYRGRSDREARETSGAGTLVPNIRRVYALVGKGEDARRLLLCREIDTNLDGIKDIVRFYNDKGEPFRELADTNYDGKVDVWTTFAGGKISAMEIDHNFDGKPDEKRFYQGGKLSRVQRDKNFDGKFDVWEVYADGHLERQGVDLDGDGRVDRWNRDEVARRLAEEKEAEEERKAEEEKKQRQLEEQRKKSEARRKKGG